MSSRPTGIRGDRKYSENIDGRWETYLILSASYVENPLNFLYTLTPVTCPLLLSDPIDTATVWAFDVITFKFGGYL